MWQKFHPKDFFISPQKFGDFVTEYLILSVFQGSKFCQKNWHFSEQKLANLYFSTVNSIKFEKKFVESFAKIKEMAKLREKSKEKEKEKPDVKATCSYSGKRNWALYTCASPFSSLNGIGSYPYGTTCVPSCTSLCRVSKNWQKLIALNDGVNGDVWMKYFVYLL